jgi:hypothetical protein
MAGLPEGAPEATRLPRIGPRPSSRAPRRSTPGRTTCMTPTATRSRTIRSWGRCVACNGWAAPAGHATTTPCRASVRTSRPATGCSTFSTRCSSDTRLQPAPSEPRPGPAASGISCPPRRPSVWRRRRWSRRWPGTRRPCAGAGVTTTYCKQAVEDLLAAAGLEWDAWSAKSTEEQARALSTALAARGARYRLKPGDRRMSHERSGDGQPVRSGQSQVTHTPATPLTGVDAAAGSGYRTRRGLPRRTSSAGGPSRGPPAGRS